MEMLLALILLATGGLLLYFGGDYLVRGSSSFALRKGVSLLVIGLTVVSMGTSAPELFVSLLAGLKGNTEISVGNIIGSNIANVALVLGVAALIRPLAIRKSTIKIEIPFVLVASVMLYLALVGDCTVVWYEGVIFLVFFVAFLYYCFRNRHAVDDEEFDLLPSRLQDWGFILLGMIGLYAGGEYFVKGAIVVAQKFGMSEFAIGLTVVALGTSLPELATSVVAALNNKDDISVGNVVGSNLFNIVFVLGLVSLVIPLPCKKVALYQDLPIMLGVLALLIPMGLRKKLSRLSGALLLAIYIGYILLIVMRKSG